MSRNEIIEKLFTGKNFNSCIDKMEPEYLRDDLKMEVALIICQWPDERIIELHSRNELEFFVVRVILNQIQSNSSPFYKKYRKYGYSLYSDFGTVEGNNLKHTGEAIVEDFIKEEEKHEARLKREQDEDKALQHMNELYWYNRDLLQAYGTHGSYRALQKATGIPLISCFNSIKKSITEIKNAI